MKAHALVHIKSYPREDLPCVYVSNYLMSVHFRIKTSPHKKAVRVMDQYLETTGGGVGSSVYQ